MADKWDAFTTWQLVLPPNRPDVWQLDIIKDKVKSYDCPKVAILGSTIEFRDLMVECGVSDVFVFERNKLFFDSVTSCRKYKNKEVIVWGDWLETLPNFMGEFDIILSDLTSGNISYSNRESFNSAIAMALNANGRFVDRILTKPMDFIAIDALIKKYETLPITNRNVNDFNSEILFCSTLLNNNDHIVDTATFYAYLLLLKKERITKFVKACYEITPNNCKWWYSLDWDIEKQMYLKYFNIKESFDEPNYSAYYGRGKLLVSTKK